MKIDIKKKTLLICVVLVIIILLIIGGLFIYKTVTKNKIIANTKSKLEQIDAEELKNKIINKLDDSELFLDVEVENLFIGTMFMDGVTFEDYVSASIVCFKDYEIIGAIEIPCFKINTDGQGNFKSIEYTDRVLDENIISPIIEEVFKEEYDIDLTIPGNSKYNKTFNSSSTTNEGNIYIVDENLFIVAYSLITGDRSLEYEDKIPKSLKKYTTKTFGLDI